MTTKDTAASNDADDRRPYKVVTMSEKFRDSIEAYAEKNNISVASLFRTAVANVIGYDLSSEPVTARRVKHATERDKLIAHRIASYKAGLQRKLALASHKARLAGKVDELAKIDAELAAVLTDGWTVPADQLAKIEKSVDESLAKDAPKEEEPEPEEEKIEPEDSELEDEDSSEE